MCIYKKSRSSSTLCETASAVGGIYTLILYLNSSHSIRESSASWLHSIVPIRKMQGIYCKMNRKKISTKFDITIKLYNTLHVDISALFFQLRKIPVTARNHAAPPNRINIVIPPSSKAGVTITRCTDMPKWTVSNITLLGLQRHGVQ